MSNLAARVERLSKLYRIGQREPSRALRDTLTDAFYAPFRRFSGAIQSAIRHPQSEMSFDPQPSVRNSQSNNTIWAFKDVSFEVKRGGVVGIIGRNRQEEEVIVRGKKMGKSRSSCLCLISG